MGVIPGRRFLFWIESLAGLSPKQLVFVAAYIGEASHNATEAARIAGYAHPNKQGPALLVNLGIQQAITEHLAHVKQQGIALKQNRIDELVARHNLMKQVIAERAAHPHLVDVPGGSTGLVVKHLKSVKHVYERDPDDHDSETRQFIVEQWESAVDTGLLKELREHEKQVAQERGEWTEKSEISGPNGGAIPIVGIEVPRPVEGT